MIKTIELINKCPWCGESPEVEEMCGQVAYGPMVGQGLFQVVCGCGASGPSLWSKLEAIHKWNWVAFGEDEKLLDNPNWGVYED